MLRLTFGFVLLLTGVAHAQETGITNGTVKGTVYTLTDTTEKDISEGWMREPIPTANVALLNPDDSSAVTGDATNLDGEYIISGVKPGNYTLRITFVGFQDKKLRISIPPGDTLIKNIQLNGLKDPHSHSRAKTNFLKINAQGVIIYQREDDFFIDDIQKRAAERSKLGDLRTKLMEPTDIVLRYWDTHGLFAGMNGILLKKIDGNWTASKLIVKECEVYHPDSLQEKISGQNKFTMDDCNEGKFQDGNFVTTVDTVIVRKFKTNDRKLRMLWNDLVEAGLLELPTHVENNIIVTDGRHFVVEVRIGNLYRASTLTYFKEPLVKAHETIKKLAKILYKSLDPWD